jgi:thioredoxin-related protein
MTEARRDNKPVVVPLTTEHCPECDKLRATTLKNPAVRDALKAAVPIMPDEKANVPLATAFKVNRFPAVILIDKAGMIRKVMTGNQDPPAIVGPLEMIAGK